MHIITDLNTGGAEMMLYKLLSLIDRSVFDTEVVSLIEIGTIGEKIKKLGIPVRSLGMKKGVPNPISLVRLLKLLRQNNPQLIQSWMYHADLLGGVAAKLAGGIPVVWGIRHGDFDSEGDKIVTIWTVKTCARLSRYLPTRIICCSEASRKVHAEMGYDDTKLDVIYNGFDLTRFKPDPSARKAVRQELGLSDDIPLIGLFARFNRQKDHKTFFEAASILLSRISETHFLLCGEDITWQNVSLLKLVKDERVQKHLHLMGTREDIERITAALDIATSSSSHGEGFPNTLGEAMACGVPCVATDVGDSAAIVGETGIIIPARDPLSLANSWQKMIELCLEERQELGRRAHQRIKKHYSLSTIVHQYETFYHALLSSELEKDYTPSS